MSTSTTERLGVAYLQTIIATNGWFFREQFVHDYGIDVIIEIVEKDRPTGQLIAVQVKTGESYFSESDDYSVTYRPDNKHIEYWLNHDLPVIIMLFHPVEKKAIWLPVTKESVVATGKAYKLIIPKESVLNEDTCYLLKRVLKLNIEKYRYQKLLLDLEWMMLINDGHDVFAEYDDWVNKSLSRTEIRVYCESKGNERQIVFPLQYWAGHASFEIIDRYIPWAEYEEDEKAFRASRRSDYESECYIGTDNETGTRYYSDEFDDWYEPPEGIQPIYEDGEIKTYRVKLILNDLGKAFLKIAEYLLEDPSFEWESFSLEE